MGPARLGRKALWLLRTPPGGFVALPGCEQYVSGIMGQLTLSSEFLVAASVVLLDPDLHGG